MVSTGLSESKRDVDQPWYRLLQAVGDGTCTPDEGAIEAMRSLESTGDGFWGLPLALAYWLEKRYQECCDVLEREDVEVACSESFIYFNLLGMSSRHLKFGETKARAAYEKALVIDPMRADTLYNLANLLKDDNQERADELYLKSLQINNFGAECWHNYGSNLTNLHFQEGAIRALRISILLDPSIADVWCNLTWLITVLIVLMKQNDVFVLAYQWISCMLNVISILVIRSSVFFALMRQLGCWNEV